MGCQPITEEDFLGSVRISLGTITRELLDFLQESEKKLAIAISIRRKSMPGEKVLINIFESICTGRPFDSQKYYGTIEKIIERVYFHRAKCLKDGFGTDENLSIDLLTFRNLCWDELTKTGTSLSDSICENTFANDKALVKFIQIAFENFFQKEIDKLTPGLNTRKRQIDRVLKPNCLTICKTFCNCWKLKDFRDISLSPADVEKLVEVSLPLTIPQVRIPKANSQRGTSIRDKDMEQFLTTVLKAAGGMTTRNNMIQLIKIKYHLVTFRRTRISPPGKEWK